MQAKLLGRGRRAVFEYDSKEESTEARMLKDTNSGVKKVCKSKKAFKQYENSCTHKVLKELPVAGQSSWQRSIAVSEGDSNEEESPAARLVKVTNLGVEKECNSKKAFKQSENSSTHNVLKELPVAG